jgi:hypothetical protein
MHETASEQCILACVQVIQRIRDGQRVGVDTTDEILREYLSTLGTARTPGIATKLARALWHRRYDGRLCHRIDITPIGTPPGSYAEVPAGLRDFDVDDQKFIAVAAAQGSVPPVFQALDREWWRRRSDLTTGGIDVQFLCVADVM